MTLILKQLFALLKVLNSDTGENQMAFGIACGLVLGFSPVFSLQTILMIIVLFFFRVQLGSALSSAFFFSLLAFLLDPLFDSIGKVVLEMNALNGIFSTLFNLPIVPFTKFYNSIVMGAMTLSLILFPFVYLISKITIVKYRVTILARFKETKFWKMVTATKFYKWYVKYNDLYN